MTFCPVLAPDPLRVTLATAGERFLRPTLLEVGSPGLVLVHNALLPPTEFSSRTSITVFDPWVSWPTVPASTTMGFLGIHAEARRDFPLALTRNRGRGSGIFSIAFESDRGTTQDASYFGETATIAGDISGEAGSGVDQFFPPVATSQRATGDRIVTLTGAESTRPNGAPISTLRALVTPAAQLKHELGGGCVAGPVAADVVGLDDGWYVAAALGAPFAWSEKGISEPDGGTTCEEVPGWGGPRQIYTGRLGADARKLQGNAIAVTESANIARIRLVPASVGEAWMAWTVAAGKGAPASLRIARIGGVGAIEAGPFTARAGDTIAPLSLAVAAFGPDLLVVTAPAGGGPGELSLRHLNDSGSEAPLLTIPTSGPVTGAVSIVADSTRGVVVSWSEVPAGASEEVIQVVKLTCLTPDH